MDLSEAIDRFRGPLVGLIVSWGAPYVDASELAQESFADAYLNRDRCRGDWQQPEVFGRWLFGIAKNKFRNWWRSQRRRNKRTRLMDNSDLDQQAVEEPVDADPRLLAIRAAIDRLPLKHRQVIMMHYLEETSVNDIAALLSVSAKTIEGRLYQARRSLKRMMTQGSSAQIGKALLL